MIFFYTQESFRTEKTGLTAGVARGALEPAGGAIENVEAKEKSLEPFSRAGTDFPSIQISTSISFMMRVSSTKKKKKKKERESAKKKLWLCAHGGFEMGVQRK